MLRTLSRLLFIAATLWASEAAALTYEVTVHGTLLTQGPGPDDPDFKVGDQLTLYATFDERDVARNLAGSGYDQVSAPMVVSGGGLTWDVFWNYTDGGAIWYVDLAEGGGPNGAAGPTFIFQNNQLVGIGNTQGHYPADPNAPSIGLGSYPGLYFRDIDFLTGETFSTFDPPVLSPVFSIGCACAYGNFRYTPGFTGEWDLANADVRILGAPEPGTWGLLIIGFGAAGAIIRRRRAVSRPASV